MDTRIIAEQLSENIGRRLPNSDIDQMRKAQDRYAFNLLENYEERTGSRELNALDFCDLRDALRLGCKTWEEYALQYGLRNDTDIARRCLGSRGFDANGKPRKFEDGALWRNYTELEATYIGNAFYAVFRAVQQVQGVYDFTRNNTEYGAA